MNTHACKIEWLEIPTADLKRAGEFYSRLFGWEIKEFSSDYWVFETGNIRGGLRKELLSGDGGITFSITVKEITAVLSAIETAGGQIQREKYLLGEGLGYSARFKDPDGNSIELWSEE
jgi:uncharacterized protein